MEWGWDRNRCIQEIRDAGLPLTGEILLLLLPLYETKGDPNPLPPVPGSAGESVGDRGSGTTQSPHSEGLGRNYAWRDFIEADQAQLALPGAFSSEDLPCSCGGETGEKGKPCPREPEKTMPTGFMR